MKKSCISKNWILSSPDYKDKISVDLPNDYTVTLKRNENAPGGTSNAFIPGTFAKYTKYIMFEDAKHTILDIDGAYMCARIYCNENLIDMHPHGYTPYLVDLTDAIQKDMNNKLEISVLNMQPSTRWYSGSGIYRDVFVWTGGRARIEPWDIFVHTKSISEGKANIAIKMTISSDEECNADVFLTIFDGDNTILTENRKYDLLKGKNEKELELSIRNPKLWDCDEPNLYRIDVCIKVDGNVEDESECSFGVRSVSVNAKDGLVINGKSLKLRGGCIHHDHGALGSAEFPAAVNRKLTKLKIAGFNAIRIAHNPPSLALLEECDKLGMIVMDEAFDMWNQPKNNADYSLWFRDWWERDISYMVQRDRNHPCVISYSIGNEIIESDGNSDGYNWSKKLAAEVRKYDDTKLVTSALTEFYWAVGDEKAPQDYKEAYDRKFKDRENYMHWDTLSEKYVEPLDIAGYNYLYYRYKNDRIKYPDRVIWGSETQVINFYDSWMATLNNSNVIGDFTWTAYDNLGEVGGGRYTWGKNSDLTVDKADYPWRTCFQGDIDISGFRRPQSYFREAVWKNITSPHIFTINPCHNGEYFTGTGWHWYDVNESWTFDDKYIGEPVKTQIYSTADEVIFYLNGEKVGSTVPKKGIAEVEIPYKKGIISAVTIKNGKKETEFSLSTTSAPYKIKIIPEKERMLADNRDLCYYDIYIVDECDRIVENAEIEIKCEVINAELMGFFSGNPKSFDQFGSDICHTYKGKAVAIIRCKNAGNPGICVCADGLKSGKNNDVISMDI